MTFAELVERSGKLHVTIMREAGVSKAGFYNWMSGRTAPQPAKVEALARSLEVDPTEIDPNWGRCKNGHADERDSRNRCSECLRQAQKRYRPNKLKQHRSVRQERKLRVQAKYGSSCICCHEAHPAFLTVDHVNNDGADHRRTIRGDDFYKWLDANPKAEEYVLMCFNCNTGRWVNGGTCPHRAVGAWPFLPDEKAAQQ